MNFLCMLQTTIILQRLMKICTINLLQESCSSVCFHNDRQFCLNTVFLFYGKKTKSISLTVPKDLCNTNHCHSNNIREKYKTHPQLLQDYTVKESRCLLQSWLVICPFYFSMLDGYILTVLKFSQIFSNFFLIN
jgi:hypothetical protein